MGDMLLLTLRRLRGPLIALIFGYGISVLGLVLVPGPVEAGQVTHLNFFHAFYVISYTATTIGFGEIPYAFSDAQRAWLTFSIYLSVTSWAYTLGSIFTLAKDTAFRTALTNSRFTRRVSLLHEPFYIIAGYGQSGNALAHAFDDLNLRTVIIEVLPERAGRADIEDYLHPPIFVAADARWPSILRDAGVGNPYCKAVIVLVGDDEVAQTIAIGASVLHPEQRVIARVHDPLARGNLEDFPNITVIDPFVAFAVNVELNLSAPSVLWVEEWLSSAPGDACPRPASTPIGHWVIFGFGRFGRAIAQALERSGCTWTAVDSDVALATDEHVRFTNNSEQSLLEIGIEKAVGFVACTDRDAINLALVSRARKLKPELSILIRQNHILDRSLIEAARADLTFVKSEVIVHECLQLLVSPLLNRFLMLVREQGKHVAEELIVRLLTELDERVPYLLAFDCLPEHPGLHEILTNPGEQPLRVADLLIDPLRPPDPLRAVPLLLCRNDENYMLPPPETVLQSGDQILFAGARNVEFLQRRFQLDPSPIDFVRTGIEPPRSWVFRKLAQRRAGKLKI